MSSTAFSVSGTADAEMHGVTDTARTSDGSIRPCSACSLFALLFLRASHAKLTVVGTKSHVPGSGMGLIS